MAAFGADWVGVRAESRTLPVVLLWASGGVRHKMGGWRAQWEWGAMWVGEDDEFSPEKITFGVPVCRASKWRSMEANVFLLDSTEILLKTGILFE